MKQKKNIAIACLIACVTSLLAISCKEDTHIIYDLKLSDNYHVFTADGGTLTVDVNTIYINGWDVDFEKTDWLTETDRTANSITFNATANESEVERPSVIIKFTAGEITKQLEILQLGDVTSNDYLLTILKEEIAAYSPDGKLLVVAEGIESYLDEPLPIYIINTETDEKKLSLEMGPYLVNNIAAISNTGVYIINNANYSGNDQIVKDGSIMDVKLPSGYKSVKLSDISPDGTVYVGHAMNYDSGTSEPFKWVNGEPVQLPRPEKTRFNPENDRVQMVMPESVSPDGKNIVGRVYTGNRNEGIYWKDDKWNWMGDIIQETVDGVEYNLYCTNRPYMPNLFSPNSRYFAGYHQAVGTNLYGVTMPVSVPALFDFETEEFLDIISEIVIESPVGGEPEHVTDEAELFYSSTENSYRRFEGVSIEAGPYLEKLYGMSIADDITVKCINKERDYLYGTFTVSTTAMKQYISFYIKPKGQPQK